MKKIITISREFGSGGRELGKRLSEILGIAYYDHEIIAGISEGNGLAKKYVNSIVEGRCAADYPIKIGRTFHFKQIFPTVISSLYDIEFDTQIKIYAEQSSIIRELASKSDCLIMGLCSDYILREYNPFNIFIHADMNSRLLRCRQNAPKDEGFSEPEMRTHIQGIDKSRANYYEFFTEQKWGVKENYNLCLNTSNTAIQGIVWPLAELLQATV